MRILALCLLLLTLCLSINSQPARSLVKKGKKVEKSEATDPDEDEEPTVTQDKQEPINEREDAGSDEQSDNKAQARKKQAGRNKNLKKEKGNKHNKAKPTHSKASDKAVEAPKQEATSSHWFIKLLLGMCVGLICLRYIAKWKADDNEIFMFIDGIMEYYTAKYVTPVIELIKPGPNYSQIQSQSHVEQDPKKKTLESGLFWETNQADGI